MATPKTGRPRGRPKGSTGGGRPPKALADDPWRYLYAAAAEAIDRNGRLVDGMSEMRICLLAALFMSGRPMVVGEPVDGVPIIAAPGASGTRGPLIAFVHERWDKALPHVRAELLRQNEADKRAEILANETWFGRHAFRREAKNLRDRLHYLRKPMNANHRHFAGLALIVRMVVSDPERAERAAVIAGEIGESSYFEATARPLMRERAACRSLGFGLPPFDLADLLRLITVFPAAEPRLEATNDNSSAA
jgi:hypothetical protein